MKAKVLLRNIGILFMVLAVGLTAYAFIADKSESDRSDKELVNATEETSPTEQTNEPTAEATEEATKATETVTITEEPSKTTELPTEDEAESENNTDASENQETQEVSASSTPSSDLVASELPSDESGESQIVTYTLNVTKGMSATQIANRLEANGIIKSAAEFTEVMVSKGVTNDINVGSYEFNSDSTYDQIISALTGKQK